MFYYELIVVFLFFLALSLHRQSKSCLNFLNF